MKPQKEKQKEDIKKNYKNNLKTRFKMAVSTHLSIITLNDNRLHVPIKKHRVIAWIKKTRAYKTHFRVKSTYRVKVRG